MSIHIIFLNKWHHIQWIFAYNTTFQHQLSTITKNFVFTRKTLQNTFKNRTNRMLIIIGFSHIWSIAKMPTRFAIWTIVVFIFRTFKFLTASFCKIWTWVSTDLTLPFFYLKKNTSSISSETIPCNRFQNGMGKLHKFYIDKSHNNTKYSAGNFWYQY